MSLQRKAIARRKRRAERVRAHLKNVSNRPRVSVSRSLKNVSAQLIDDAVHATIASATSRTLTDFKGDKRAVAHAVGVELAKKALEKGINQVYFDRGRFLYHGRVKALAEGLREGGLHI